MDLLAHLQWDEPVTGSLPGFSEGGQEEAPRGNDGHSTGGGEVAHYLARHGESRVAKAILISAVTPLMVKTGANPGGLPKEVFDGLHAQLAVNRSRF